MEKLTSMKAIKQFFQEGDNGRPVTMDELKEFTKDKAALHELGKLSAEALGAEWDPPATTA